MDSLRSPLTPDVRRGCAAQSSALTVHCLQQSPSRPARPPAHRLNSDGSQRCPLTSRAPFGVRRSPRSCPVFPGHIDMHLTPLTARPLWLAVPPRRRGQGIQDSSSCRVPSPHAPPRRSHYIETRRETRNAQLHSTGAIRLTTASSAHLRHRPGPFPRASAAPVFLNPPRFHSAAPNPGVQWTRSARH